MRPEAGFAGRAREPVHAGAEIALTALVAAGVLFFGGVYPAFQAAAFAVALGILGAFAALRGVRGRQSWPLAPAAVPVAALLAFGAAQVGFGISFGAEETRAALLRYGAAAVVFLVTASLARSESAVRRLALGVVALGAFEALYGIAEHFSGHEHILFWPKTYPGTVSGTYVNRNHFAGMLAVLTPIGLGLALAEPSVWRRSIPRFRTRLALAVDDPAFWRRTLLFAAAAVMGLGACLSFSRGGVLALGFGLVVFAALFTRGRRGRGRALIGPALLLLLTGLGLLAFGPEGLVRRFALLPHDAVGEGSRLAFARGTLAMIADHPLGGVGLGAYETAFTGYQQGWVGGLRVDHAHNDYLELAAEAGIPLALLVLAGALALAARGVRAAGRDLSRPVAFGLVAALAAAAAHALVDFDFQLGGSITLLALVCGCLAGPGAPRLSLHGSFARAGAVVSLAAIALLLPYPIRVLRAELLANPTVRRADDRREPAERLQALEAAIALRPEKVAYRLEAAYLRKEAFEDSIDAAAREAARNVLAAAAPYGPEPRPPDGLVGTLRGSIRAARAAEEAALIERSLADLRAARAAEPRNARVLAEIARFTADREEAFEVSAAAARAFPFGATTLASAAIGRLRFDPSDEAAVEWLGRGLALDEREVGWAVRNALRIGAVDAAGRALPRTLGARRKFASILLRDGRLELAGRELDGLAALEEGEAAVAAEAAAPAEAGVAAEAAAPLEAIAPGGPRETILPGDWLAKPEGKPLEALRAPVLRLAGARRAFTRVGAAGNVSIETAMMPGHPATFLCVLFEGRHLGHVLVRDGWAAEAFGVPGPGRLELAVANDRHRLAERSAGTVLVRDVTLTRD